MARLTARRLSAVIPRGPLSTRAPEGDHHGAGGSSVRSSVRSTVRSTNVGVEYGSHLWHRCDRSEQAGGIFRHDKRSRQNRPGLLIADFTYFRRQAERSTRCRRVESWRSLPYAEAGQSKSIAPHRENELLQV